jgi:hypothetical protein
LILFSRSRLYTSHLPPLLYSCTLTLPLRCTANAKLPNDRPGRPFLPAFPPSSLLHRLPLPPLTDTLSISLASPQWVVGIATHFSAIALSKTSKDLPEFDNVAPREYLNKIRKLEKQSSDVKKLLRIEGAQQNTYENLGTFPLVLPLVPLTRSSPPAAYSILNWTY